MYLGWNIYRCHTLIILRSASSSRTHLFTSSVIEYANTARASLPGAERVRLHDSAWLPVFRYRYCVRQVMPHKTSCSHTVKNTSQSNEETGNTPRDKTEQVTSGMKQSLSFQMLTFFLRNSNNKYRYMVLQCAVTDHCTASVQVACKPIIFSYLLKARIKHEGTSEHISFQLQKDDNSHNFSFSYSFYFWCKRAFTFAKNKLFFTY